MPALLRHPTARLLTTTAAVGSCTDWILFATMVVTVDTLLGGGPWATAAVLAARIVPGVCFAPLAARAIDRVPLRTSLLAHELVRLVAVAVLAVAAATTTLVAAVVGIVVLEFAAAMQAAGRESLTSRSVTPTLFTPLNTVTAVLGYALLPLGAVVVGAVGTAAGWGLALAGYGIVAGTYAATARTTFAPRPDHAVSSAECAVATASTGTEVRDDAGWQRLTVAASLGLLPAVACFAIGATLAETWLGDRTATGLLYGLVLAGGAIGFALANARRPPASVGMVTAAVGVTACLVGAWAPGLVVLGVGAGAAYLDLQTRLQTAASDPSEFAAAFAVLKGATGVAVLGAPALVGLGGVPAVLVAGIVAALVGASVAAGSRTPELVAVLTTFPRRVVRALVRGTVIALVRLAVDVRVDGGERRVDGPAVVVSNHPHVADGALALLIDRQLRPVARWQPQRLARLAIWAGDAVVTTAGTGLDPRPAYVQAADHLVAGGRIWLAPEGGSHQSPVLREPRTGAVRMAASAGVPIQPLAIRWHDGVGGPGLGAWRPWRRAAVTLTWGHPLPAPTGTDDADAVARAGRAMMRALAATDPAAGLVVPSTSAAVPVLAGAA